MKTAVERERFGLAVGASGWLLIVYVIFSPAVGFAQAPTYDWTRQIGGAKNEVVSDVALDSNGNIYLVGDFEGTVNFAAGFGGSDSKTSAGDADIFVTRINADGSYGWTRRIGGLDNSGTGTSIATDSSGNVYVTGVISGPVNFAADFGGSDIKAPTLWFPAFITRINADGSYGWTRIVGGTSLPGAGAAIYVKPGGDIYLIGIFFGTFNFAADFGGNDLKTSAGENDVFVSRIGTDGSYVWTRRIGGADGDYGAALAVDSSANVYLTGTFLGTVNFAADFGGADSKTVSGTPSRNDFDAFVTRINADGSYGWTRKIGGTEWEMGRDIILDSAGNIFVAGEYYGPLDFAVDFGGNDPKTHAGSGYSDIFLTRINVNGSYAWTKTLGGESFDNNPHLALDSAGNIYLAAFFDKFINFAADFGRSDYKVGSGGFITRINSDLTYAWTRSFIIDSPWWLPGAGFAAIAIDGNGHLYLGGVFGSPKINFARDFGGFDEISLVGGYDAFVTRISSPPTANGVGLPDGLEELSSCHTSGFPDSDGDGLCDGPFDVPGVCGGGEDMDWDGIVDIGETDPCTEDTDGDRLGDGDEVMEYGTWPTTDDTDSDGLNDYDEILKYQTDPTEWDSDSDGLGDEEEIRVFDSDPLNPDTDGDYLYDGEEVYKYHTDVLDDDSDNDGLTDGNEIAILTDPLDPDTDMDGLDDFIESHTLGTDPLDPDTDGDGLDDGEEVNTFLTDPLVQDTDGDGKSDGLEVARGTNPLKKPVGGGSGSGGGGCVLAPGKSGGGAGLWLVLPAALVLAGRAARRRKARD